MATMSKVQVAAERAYWAIVQECLVRLHGWDLDLASDAVTDLRSRLARSANPRVLEISFHMEPLYVANELAGRELDDAVVSAEYRAILARHAPLSALPDDASIERLHDFAGAAFGPPMSQEERLAEFPPGPPRPTTQERYREYLRQLGSDSVGRLELGPDDRPIVERARLKAAARAEGVTLHIERKGNVILFWRIDENTKR